MLDILEKFVEFDLGGSEYDDFGESGVTEATKIPKKEPTFNEIPSGIIDADDDEPIEEVEKVEEKPAEVPTEEPIVEEEEATEDNDTIVNDSTDTNPGTKKVAEGEEINTDVLTVVKALQKSNLLIVGEDFDPETADDEALYKAVENTFERIQQMASESIFNFLDDDIKRYAAWKHKNPQGTLEEFTNLKNNNYSSLNYDVDNEADQEKIVKLYLSKTTNYSNERIDSFVEALKSSDMLARQAMQDYQELTALEENERQNIEKESKKLLAERLENQKKAKMELIKVIKNTDLEDVRKAKLESFVTKYVFNDKTGVPRTEFDNKLSQLSTNQEHLIQFANLLLDYDPEKGFNLEPVIKREKTKEITNIREVINKATSPIQQRKSIQKPMSDFNWDKWLQRMG